jgi:uncharacterized membrane protein YbhN (UPF0104 family)
MQKFLALVVKAAVSIALLYFAVGRVNLGILAERLQQVRLEWLLAAVAVLVVQAFVVGLRWREIALQSGAPISPGRAFRFMLIAGLFNQTLPSTVGGDAARIWLLAKEGAGWAKATYSVLVDRAAGILMLAVLVLVCLPWSFNLIQNPVGRTALLVIGLGCIAAPAAFAALAHERFRFLHRWWLTRHLAEAAGIARAVFVSGRTAGLVLGLTLVVHVMTVIAAWLAAKSVAAPFQFAHALLVVPPILLIASIPISIAGWGLRESAMVVAFAYAGLAESDGLLVSVLLGAAMFAVGLIGGAVWLASPGTLRFGAANADALDPAEAAADDPQTR